MGRGTGGGGTDGFSEANSDIFNYVSEKVKEKFKLIGPFMPEGHDLMGKDEEEGEMEENGAYYKGLVNKST